MFDKSQRSRFDYWFAHWCAFQMTALNYKSWRLKYLFHDMEKPFLRLFMKYKKLQKLHRTHNRHHPEWLESRLKGDVSEAKLRKLLEKFDYHGAAIDWECSHFTKVAQPRDAYHEYLTVFNYNNFAKKYPNIARMCYNEFSMRMFNAIKELGLYRDGKF